MVEDKIIVFDGVCVLCSGWINFVLKRDRRRQFFFAAMQSEAGRTLLVQHGLDADDPASFLLLDRGVAYADSAAIIRLLRHFSLPWRMLAGALTLVPRSWRDAGYRTVARNRYRWFGRFDACGIPAPENAHRFLR